MKLLVFQCVTTASFHVNRQHWEKSVHFFHDSEYIHVFLVLVSPAPVPEPQMYLNSAEQGEGSPPSTS